jgi:hypothetical protein
MKRLAATASIALGVACIANAQSSIPAPQPADPHSQTAPGTQPNPEPSAGRPAQSGVYGRDRTGPVTFEEADKNKDGTVDREEAKSIPGFKFSRADKDKSESVSRQEFQTAMAGSQPRG